MLLSPASRPARSRRPSARRTAPIRRRAAPRRCATDLCDARRRPLAGRGRSRRQRARRRHPRASARWNPRGIAPRGPRPWRRSRRPSRRGKGLRADDHVSAHTLVIDPGCRARARGILYWTGVRPREIERERERERERDREREAREQGAGRRTLPPWLSLLLDPDGVQPGWWPPRAARASSASLPPYGSCSHSAAAPWPCSLKTSMELAPAAPDGVQPAPSPCEREWTDAQCC